jgi:5-methylthioadenosine/S-adenosylhomocysteine deaminase
MRPSPVLIRGGIVLPLDGRRTAHDPGSVIIDGNEIVAVGPVEQLDADPRARDAEIVDARGHAVLPGLQNCHLHSGLLRGTAESLALFEWLEAYVDPAHRALTPEIARAASDLAYTESVRFGTTSVMDMWRFMEGSAAAAEAIGIRATLVPYVADSGGYDYFESTASNRRLLETHRSAVDGRVRAWVGLELLAYCSERAFQAAIEMADEFDTGIHVHSSETQREVDDALRLYGRRPIEEFGHRGILGPRTVIAHCVWVDDREIELMAETGTAVAHCPCSNMKLSSGPAPIGAMRAAGVTVGLGTDGEKENNNLDCFEEMKFASLLQKVTTRDPTTGDPWDVLEMATIDGARALGLDAISGSLEPGKRADIVTVDLQRVHFTPLFSGENFNLPAHLVFTASGSDVDQVWVDGRLLVESGVVRSVDEDTVRRRAQDAAEELFERRAALDQPAVRSA